MEEIISENESMVRVLHETASFRAFDLSLVFDVSIESWAFDSDCLTL